MAARHGHLAPFLAVLQGRSGISYTRLAELTGLGVGTLHRRAHGPMGMGPAAVERMARALGASAEELRQVRILDALDRGALPLPSGVGEEAVGRALDALVGAS